MDIKQFLSWNLTAVPCARLRELVRTGTADLTGLGIEKGRPRAHPEALSGQTSYTKSTAGKLRALTADPDYQLEPGRTLVGEQPEIS
jgi:hypothetical protein